MNKISLMLWKLDRDINYIKLVSCFMNLWLLPIKIPGSKNFEFLIISLVIKFLFFYRIFICIWVNFLAHKSSYFSRLQRFKKALLIIIIFLSENIIWSRAFIRSRKWLSCKCLRFFIIWFIYWCLINLGSNGYLGQSYPFSN